MNQVIAKDERGLKYLLVNLPEDWSVSVNRKQVYGGYGYPFCFDIWAVSPDNTAAVQYFSPLNYHQDYLRSYKENSIDDYGSLLRSFMTVEDFLDQCAFNIFKDYEGFKFETELAPTYSPNTDYLLLSQKRFKEISEKYAHENNGRVLNSYYCKALTRIYTYSNNGVKRKIAYSAFIEAQEITEYREAKIPSTILSDPFLSSTAKGMYPGLFLDQSGRYLYQLDHSTYWKVSNRTYCDAKEEMFDKLYKGVYKDFCSGYQWDKELVAELNRLQQAFNENKRLKREDAKRASEITHQMEMDRIKAAKERADINREASNQISQIQRSAYENRQKALDKANRQFSDSYLGNKRYADQYGDEHLVHSTDRYAFKKGNKIITSDDPRSPGFGWEELKKKD